MQTMNDRSLIFLNSMGDIEITWDSTDDDIMREVIQKKMDEGIKFFVYKPLFGTFLRRRSQIKTVDDLTKHSITVKDEDIEHLFKTGKVQFSRREGSFKDTAVVRVTDAATVARGHAIGVKPYAGG